MKAVSSLWNVWAGLRQLVSRIREDSESGRAAGFVDELGARAAALENDLTLMKGGEFRAMTDANDGRVCELPRQRSWLRESRAAVASSSTMISGRWRKSRAKAKRCFSPPDKI